MAGNQLRNIEPPRTTLKEANLPCVSFYQLFLEVLVQQHLVAILFQVAEQLCDISSLGSSVILDLCFQILPKERNYGSREEQNGTRMVLEE